MIDIEHILSHTSHRPFALPNGPWRYYQEWNQALFLHWKIPYEVLKGLVPEHFIIDHFKGEYFISIVLFSMQKIRPRNLPSISFISDFAEVNVRTYINNDNKQGVYFLSIEAQKLISTMIARIISGLPYKKSKMNRTNTKFYSANKKLHYFIDTEFEIQSSITNTSELDKWLTERYCLYFDKDENFYRYDIHHQAWDINNVVLKKLSLNYPIGKLNLSDSLPDLAHYSAGVKVLAWSRQKI